MAHIQAIQTQTDFRGRVDTVDESDDVGWFASVNSNWIVASDELDRIFRVRFALVASSISGQVFATYTLGYSYNNGSFIPVNTTSSVIKSVNSTQPGYDDDDTASQLITNDPDFVTPNELINEGDNETGFVVWDSDVSTLQSCESEWVLQLVPEGFNKGDTIELRLRTSGGVPIGGGYDHSPIIIIGGPQIRIKGRTVLNKGRTMKIK